MKNGVKIFLRNPQGKYLFVLRDDKPNIPAPNQWGLIGGGIESNESPIEALKREIDEEINIPVHKIKYIGKREIVGNFNGPYHIQGYYFLGEISETNEDNILLFEGQKVGLFSVNEISNNPQSSKSLIDTINKFQSILK